MRLPSLTAAGVAILLIAASGCSSGSEPAQASAAKPEFCGWATQIELAIPPEPEPVNPEEPVDFDRLVSISDSLTTFAATLEGAAPFAPSDEQGSFVELASFNREVASVITGSGSLQDGSGEEATAAADVVVRSLSANCGVSISATDTLAFYDS